MSAIRTVIILSLFFLIRPACCFSQIEGAITAGEKEIYAVGDRITLTVKVHALPGTCAGGMEQTRFYQKGLYILSQTGWKQDEGDEWEKTVTVKITGKKSDESVLTIIRKSDRENELFQFKFPVNI